MKFNPKQIIKNNRRIFSNFSYLAILEVFGLIAPIITYLYLVKVLGTELYGWVITAQITASYAVILIDFGFRRVSAKYVANSKNNQTELNKVVSTVVIMRIVLWALSFFLYTSIIYLIPSYREQSLLFVLSYGHTISSALLPDFYFQGIEQMKYITIINLLMRIIFIGATFIVITAPSQYIFVPVLWSIGYLLGGIYSLYVVFGKHKVQLVRPSIQDYKFHLKETTPIFLSDVMLNLKDKFNYNIMGGMLNMSNVVIYDIGTKIVNLLVKPTWILSTVVFPSMSKKPDINKTKHILTFLLIISIFMVGIAYLFLPYIVKLFIQEEVDLLPLRVYLLVPIFTGLSFYIPSGIFVVFGRNKYVLYSTAFSTISYAVLLVIMWYYGLLNSILNFIILTVASYFVETVFRLYLSGKIFKTHSQNQVS